MDSCVYLIMIPWSQWEGLVPILAVFYVYAGHRTESTSFAEEKTIWSPYTGKFDEKFYNPSSTEMPEIDSILCY